MNVETVELDCVWEDCRDALNTIAGTPYGPLIAALPSDGQERARAGLRRRLGCSADGALTVRTVSNIARGVR